jgi:hypothetical protein
MTANNENSWGCLGAIFRLFFKPDSKPSKSDVTFLEPDPSAREGPLPYRLRDDFLSTAEHSFYLVLKSMMGSYFIICPKVSLSDIFYVTHPNVNQSFLNKINRKHVDFLICETETIKPRFAIELDDKSHARPDRMERDEFVEELFEAANLPLIRIPVRPTYNTAELGVLFREAIQKGQTASSPFSQGAQKSFTTDPIPVPTTAPTCPKCGQTMVLRTSQNGANKGNRFYGCVNYPRCKMILPAN